MTYEEQLKDRRWCLTRNVILIRDNNCCTRCGSTKYLQVHHKYYEYGKMAWEYPFDALVTLCNKCHEVTHGISDGNSRSSHTQHIGMVFRDIIETIINKKK